MSERRASQLLWAAVLIIGGVILLLLNFDVLSAYEPVAHYVVAGALALAGVAFFVSATAAKSWVRIIPAWTLLSLAVMVILGSGDAPNTHLVAATLFWGLALAFVHIYLLARQANWWAIIPGGFMLVLGSVIALARVINNLELLGALLFTGIGLVFVAIYLLGGAGKHWWALLPGSILILFGFFVLTGSRFTENGIMRWWPLLAIVAGIWVAWRALTMRAAPPAFESHHAPTTRPAPAARPSPAIATSQDRQALGEYSAPAPGATIDVLADPD